ncbi:MAG: hypothetical protein ACN6ON_18565 [Sphingobacterium sp.]
MDNKTLKYFVFGLVIFILSCGSTGKRFSPAHNIVIKFNHWFTFDFDSRVLTLKFDGEDAIRDTLHFSDDQLKLIEKTFYEKRIGEIDTEVRLGRFIEYPSSAYIIDILQNNKLQGTIHWESDYRKNHVSTTQGYIDFCIILMDIITSKREFLKMNGISLEKQEKYLRDTYLKKQTD